MNNTTGMTTDLYSRFKSIIFLFPIPVKNTTGVTTELLYISDSKMSPFCPIHVKNTTGVTNELNLYSRFTNVTFLCPTHVENAGSTVELII